jgi:hypothetical protein
VKSIAVRSMLSQSGNATQVPAHHCTHDSARFVLPIGHSSGCIINCTQAHRGGYNSPASQPTASVFIGSTANDAVSVRSQVEHSNLRVSNPDLPGEMRANAIRCLHTGHIGRSLIQAVIHWPQRILIYPNPISKRQMVSARQQLSHADQG